MYRFYKSNQFGKYNVSRPEDRTIDGIVFASKAEMRRYAELKIMQNSGIIRNLVLQPKFELIPGFTLHKIQYLPTYYYADFQYYDNEHKKRIVEDVKGVETDVFKIKAKLMAYRHHIEIKKVKLSEIR